MNTLSKVFVVVNLVLAVFFAAFTLTLYSKRVDFKGKWEDSKEKYRRDTGEKDDQIKDLKGKVTRLTGEFRTERERNLSLIEQHEDLQDKQKRTTVELFEVQEERRALMERARAKDHELLRRHEQINTMHNIVLKQQQALEVAKANLRNAQNQRVEMENELNNSRQQLVAVRKEKARLERDLHHNSWIIQKLMEQGVPVNDIIQSGETQPARPIEGKVLAVRPEVNLVMLSVGSQDGVKKGYRFTVYRGEQYIGKVEVEKVFDDMASARILVDWTKQPIKENDDASTSVYGGG